MPQPDPSDSPPSPLMRAAGATSGTWRKLRQLRHDRRPRVAVLRLHGVIAPAARLRSSLSAAALSAPLQAAFSMPGVKAVALSINSPGGSPVQSNLILKRIRALAEEKEIPVVAFGEDVMASGGYMLACAADEIFADSSSIVGSIGVVSSGFGFTKLMEQLGVERRLHTAGQRKALLDPFSPEDPDDVKHLETIQKEVHEGFKALVRDRRKDKLKGDEADLFSGAFWTGQQALERGLIDGIGDMRQVLRERFGEKVRFRVVGEQRQFWRRMRGAGDINDLAQALGHGPDPSSIAEGFAASLETRAIWARFGL